MVRAFLNQPSIKEAHEEYLKSWGIPAVQLSWDGKKPSLTAFTKRFKKDYEARQRFLAKRGATKTATAVLDPEVEGIEPDPIIQAETEGHQQTILTKLMEALVALQAPQDAEASTEDKLLGKTVRPENMDKMPSPSQLYFFLHRAKEAGYQYAIVPLTRGEAAVQRAAFERGNSYADYLAAYEA